ncbi:MAG: hypothetical protein QW331_02225 [Candidatus Woesearchaeota archaeon]
MRAPNIVAKVKLEDRIKKLFPTIKQQDFRRAYEVCLIPILTYDKIEYIRKKDEGEIIRYFREVVERRKNGNVVLDEEEAREYLFQLSKREISSAMYREFIAFVCSQNRNPIKNPKRITKAQIEAAYIMYENPFCRIHHKFELRQR